MTDDRRTVKVSSLLPGDVLEVGGETWLVLSRDWLTLETLTLETGRHAVTYHGLDRLLAARLMLRGPLPSERSENK